MEVEQVPAGQQFQQPYQRPLPNATTVLVMGILSLVFCGVIGLVLGIIGLSMGSKELVKYDASPGLYTDSSYRNLKAGKTCSLIGVIVQSVAIVFLIIYLIVIAIFVGSVSNFHY